MEGKEGNKEWRERKEMKEWREREEMKGWKVREEKRNRGKGRT